MPLYIHRSIEKELRMACAEFPVVALTGPRQTGKSTLLRKIFSKYDYSTLDDPLTRKFAKEDPRAFLSRSRRLIIDEIQYLPEIVPYIKMSVDANRSLKGRFLLTGSQYFPLMTGLGESLAGRAALYELLGFSMEEIGQDPLSRHAESPFDLIFRGFYPDVVAHGADRSRFFSSYIQTYLERDIRQISSVHDLRIFQNFLELLAARMGSLLNLNEIAKECGVSFTSARRWLSLLESTRIVYLLRPYHKNTTKRVIKSPKLYFTDTGLLAYLLRYPSPLLMRRGPQAGAFFENFIVVEFLKHKLNKNLNYELYFYRDSNLNEIDLLIDFGTSLKVVEIKATSTPSFEHVSALKKMASQLNAATGYLTALTEKEETVGKNLKILPWHQATDSLTAM